MSKPAFPQPIHKAHFDTTPDDFRETGCDGISERRLLAGMILGHAVQGVLVNPPKETPTIETVQTIVKACVVFADELIKQTEET